jgi:hypothetical protein
MAETANSTAVFKDIEVATVNHAEMQTV